MSSKKMEKGLSEQVDKEFYSALLYLSMSGYFESENLPGFATWMRLQYQEELAHALRLFDFILRNGGRPTLGALKKPSADFKGPHAVMAAALKHEKAITTSINKLYELAVAEKDWPTQVELQWFITEQTEEEQTVGEIVAQLEMVGNDGPALLMMDRDMSGRESKA